MLFTDSSSQTEKQELGTRQTKDPTIEDLQKQNEVLMQQVKERGSELESVNSIRQKLQEKLDATKSELPALQKELESLRQKLDIAQREVASSQTAGGQTTNASSSE